MKEEGENEEEVFILFLWPGGEKWLEWLQLSNELMDIGHWGHSNKHTDNINSGRVG